MFASDTFIKWSSTENGEKFSYVGRVVKCTDDFVEFVIDTGSTLGVPLDEGTFVQVTKPRKWTENNLPTPAPQAKAAPAPQRTQQPRKQSADGSTKAEKAMVIYNDIVGKGHGKEMCIQRFQDVLDMSPAGASTYFYNCKKKAV